MPEISPELAARIDSLKASHAENPARFFMPLASAWREAGETGRAEELLRENLKRHPGYLSAHVLLGRCLADRGAYAEARNEFQYVLSVDPQNLIALKILGDMAAGGGDRDEARRWYNELLAVDPMNAEAKQSLADMDAAPPAAPAAAAPSAEPEHDGFGMVELDGAGEVPDHAAAHADPGTWRELTLDEEHAAAAPADDHAGHDFEALDFGAVDLSEPAHAEEATHEEPAAAAAGFDAWGSVDDGQSAVESGDVAPLELEDFYGGGAAPSFAAPDEHDHDEHGEVVTETIAELYARQGFPDRAADVYRELIARRGEEPALVRRLGELERQMAGTTQSSVEAAPAAESAAPSPEAAPADQTASTEEEQGVPSWLETVDAVIAGQERAAASAEPSPEVHATEAGAAPQPPAEAAEPAPEAAAEPEPAVASVEAAPAAAQPTGDAFADSFANGFAGAEAAPAAERREWEPPRVEETEAAPELAGAEAFASTLEPSAAPSTEEAAPAAEAQPEAAAAPSEPQPVAAAAPAAGQSISVYLTSILAWRPGAATPAEGAPAPAAESDEAPAPTDAGAPPPPQPWDEQTLGAAVEQPPMDEPWMAGGPSVADQPAGAGDEPWAIEPEPEQPEPWADTPSAEQEPWAEPAAEADVGEEGLPWLAPPTEQPAAEGTQPAAGGMAPAAEAMPWETPFELSSEVPQEPTAERPPPRQEPAVEPSGGFSFEEFFDRPAEPQQEPTPQPAAQSEPAPTTAPQPQQAAPAQEPPAAAQPAGEEDEDLESFQAWLQSLKR